jgi:predicted metalloprotease with PDZ domain
MKPPLTVTYQLALPDPKTHLVHVEMRFAADAAAFPDGVTVFMAVWTPGSYLVREYSRHVEGLTAVGPARARKIRKNEWWVSPGAAREVVLRYRVYANELTVRTNHVDETHAFLVGAGTFLGIKGREDASARVLVDAPAGWRTATSLPTLDGALHAADFDALIDAPFEIGFHREERFELLGATHRYAIWPASSVTDADARRLVDDTRTILETEARLFGGSLPYDAYDLLLHFSSHGRGGLEHEKGAALIAAPGSFATRSAYLDFLSLITHETFHAWNVKRIRPAGLKPYRYSEECYTRLLWWFEGATSYYDWRILALARLCTIEEYLEHLAAEIAYLDQTPGRLVHSLEEASFDAWIKAYRPDENSLNSSVSYYRKGEVVCALLDLQIRARATRAGHPPSASLDAVLSHLWREHGDPARPVPEDAMQSIFERAAGVPLGDLFDAWVRSPVEIDYASTLATVGLHLERTPRNDAAPPSLGIRLRSETGRAIVASVTRESSAFRAAIDAGDEIVAVGGARLEGSNLDGALRGHAAGEDVEIVVARDGRLLNRRATLDPPLSDRVRLVPSPDASPAARDAFAAWLGAPHPAWSKAKA